MAKAGRGADQYMLRFPDGLRDRIKAYAERMGTSINSEIIRILEIEFPEQVSVDDRLRDLAEMLAILTRKNEDARFEEFSEKVKDTIVGVVSGRVKGVDEDTRDLMGALWDEYQERLSEAAYDQAKDQHWGRTEEEIQTFEVTGKYEKYGEPLHPKPKPFSDAYDLMQMLPPRLLSDLAIRLKAGDVKGAADVIKSLSEKDLRTRLSAIEAHADEVLRRTRDINTPNTDNDPFER